MHHFILTCSLWLEALVKHEVKKQGWNITEVHDKAIYFDGEIELIARMNIWSRFWNVLYFVLDSENNVTNFDSYFDIVFSQDWKKYIPRGFKVNIKATSLKSELGSTSTLQALAKKAIAKKIMGERYLEEDEDIGKIDIRILIENNTLRILLNTTGTGLHKRWYREMTWDAPLKENIAAGLVILSGWKFREPLYDIFCGSGTIGIEAAMIARNIAPGMKRHFAFEKWTWLPENIYEQEKTLAKKQEFTGEYKIYCSDIRKDIIELAKRNAKFAGVGDTITFGTQDYTTYIRRDLEWYLISNPPYGLRLDEADVPKIHQDISELLKKNTKLFGGIISAHSEFEEYSNMKYKKRKLYNGWEMCYFYKKEQN